jgi:hypothetical protein
MLWNIKQLHTVNLNITDKHRLGDNSSTTGVEINQVENSTHRAQNRDLHIIVLIDLYSEKNQMLKQNMILDKGNNWYFKGPVVGREASKP